MLVVFLFELSLKPNDVSCIFIFNSVIQIAQILSDFYYW